MHTTINQKILALAVMVSVLGLSAPVAAAPPVFSNIDLTTPGTNRTLTLPAAADNSPVISLGSAVDPETGTVVEGYAIVHYKADFTHREGHAKGGKSGGNGAGACYGFLASGARWKTVEPWVVNASNTRGLDAAFVASNLAADIAKWEDAADGTVGDAGSVDILGVGSSTSDVLVADTSSPDGVNEVYFADVSSSGAIAVTIVWGYFSGPPFARELLEWDMIFDDVDFDWSPTGEASKMDFENIATHELGHSVGLGDLYNSGCSEETMYGYAAFGEIKKRDLNSGDIAGVSKLY